MTTPTVYSGTLAAYITNDWTTTKDVAESNTPLQSLNYYQDDAQVPGWIKVGMAELTVTMFPESTVIAGMVESIDAQIANTYAEAESKINLLKEKKQSLLAITMESSSS